MLEIVAQSKTVVRRTTTFKVVTPVDEVITAFIRQGKTGSLTIHLSQGGIGGYEWVETESKVQTAALTKKTIDTKAGT
jgi:hypothetical protein